jgi:hypothetical protein
VWLRRRLAVAKTARVSSADRALPEGRDDAAEGRGCGGQVAGEALLAVAVEDAEEQRPGVQVPAGLASGVGRGGEVAPEGLRLGREGGGWVPPPSSQA